MVADEMTEGVIDAFETVDVDQQQRQVVAMPVMTTDLCREAFVELFSVGQPCQGIMTGHLPPVRRVDQRRGGTDQRVEMAREFGVVATGPIRDTCHAQTLVAEKQGDTQEVTGHFRPFFSSREICLC
jgi:hypothetical protein